MDSILQTLHIDRVSQYITQQLNMPWAFKYIYYILIILIIILFFSILKMFGSLLSNLLKPLYRIKNKINEIRQIKTNEKLIRKNISKLLSQKDYKAAAELSVSINEPEEAAKLYLKAGFPAVAADLYEDMGNLEKAAMFYKEANNFTRSAELFEKTGDIRNAAQSYEAGGFFKKAAELFEKTNEHLKAAELYERCFIEEGPRRTIDKTNRGYAYLSGKMYEKADQFDKKAIAVYYGFLIPHSLCCGVSSYPTLERGGG